MDEEVEETFDDIVKLRAGFYKCKQCGKVAPQKWRIRRHLETHVQLDVKCDHCELTFRNMTSKNQHVYRRHRSNETF